MNYVHHKCQFLQVRRLKPAHLPCRPRRGMTGVKGA